MTRRPTQPGDSVPELFRQPSPVEVARAVGEQEANRCEAKAEREGFDSGEAAEWILAYLRRQGECSGEELVRQARGAGHNPSDARAFGGIFQRLCRARLIVCLRSDLPRINGHGTSGGKLWRAA